MAAALLSALAVHEHRREVTVEERRLVMAQVADQLVGRALMQRYGVGGRGRRGAIQDLMRATYHHPRWLTSPRQLTRAVTAVLAPKWLIVRVKSALMARMRYF